MLEAGRSQRYFAHVLGVSKGVFRFQMTGNVLQGHAGSRQLSTTQAKVRFIVLQGQAPTVLERYDLL
jgi:hypothetical protein